MIVFTVTIKERTLRVIGFHCSALMSSRFSRLLSDVSIKSSLSSSSSVIIDVGAAGVIDANGSGLDSTLTG